MQRAISNPYNSITTYDNINFNNDESCPVTIVTNDIFNYITKELRARDLEAFGTTCKHFCKLAENSSIWDELCINARKFGSKLIPQKNISSKVAFRKAIEQEEPAALLSKVYFLCKNQFVKKNNLEIIKILDKLFDQTNEESIIKKAKFKKAELLTSVCPPKKYINIDFLQQINQITGEILSNQTSYYNDESLINYLKAKIDGLFPFRSPKTFQEIMNQLYEINLDPNLSNRLKNEAQILFYILFLNNTIYVLNFDKYNIILSKECVLQRLKEIFYKKSLSIEQKAIVALYIAAQLSCRTEEHMILEAGHFLKNIIDDLDVCETTRMSAALELAKLRLEKNISLIDDEKAIEYLIQIKECQEAKEIHSLAFMYFAQFRLQNRTNKRKMVI